MIRTHWLLQELAGASDLGTAVGYRIGKTAAVINPAGSNAAKAFSLISQSFLETLNCHFWQ
jgi:hypothetical protein